VNIVYTSLCFVLVGTVAWAGEAPNEIVLYIDSLLAVSCCYAPLATTIETNGATSMKVPSIETFRVSRRIGIMGGACPCVGRLSGILGVASDKVSVLLRLGMRGDKLVRMADSSRVET
jgi:hypothetical protein